MSGEKFPYNLCAMIYNRESDKGSDYFFDISVDILCDIVFVIACHTTSSMTCDV